MLSEIALRVYPGLLFAYHGRSLLITDTGGTIAQELQGLYEHDARLLSRYRLLVNGAPPRLDAISAINPHSTLGYYVCPPRADSDDDKDALGLSTDEIDRQVVIRVARFVGQGMHEDVEVTNHGLDRAELELTWELDADFADLLEARGGVRRQEAPVSVDWRLTPEGGGELRFDYRHPELKRGVIVRFPSVGAPPRCEEGKVTYKIELGAQESCWFCVEVSPVSDGEVCKPFFGCDAFGSEQSEVDRIKHAWLRDATRIRTGNPVVQQTWNRAVSDLASLALGHEESDAEKMVTMAGVPLYDTFFGRDALTIGGQGLFISPRLAEGALRTAARYIGEKDDDFYDEQPGRVVQQVRDSPLGLLGITPWLHDYGDYAAPCAFLVLLGGYHVVTGDRELTRQMLDPAKKVLDWLDNRADLDGDGFLEYKSRSTKGQKHQGWKDSGDPVRYEDGSEAEPPIAACEIQGYWYAAKLLMAEVFMALGEPARAAGLLRDAVALKKRFNERFWMPEEQFYAFALDSEKRQVKSITSNVGHCLATGIIEHAHAAETVRRLMAPDMFSGWGIRTLSDKHPAYNPIKYHLGSVWPVENATTAFGMKRYGFWRECNAVAKGMFDAATLFEHHRLPETFGGYPRDKRHPHPGIYPDACAPQGWSATAIAWLIQAMLGLWSYAPLNLVMVDPVLPPWLPELTVRDLHVGRSRVSIRFKRDRSGKTDYKVLERKGPVHVVRQPAPDDVSAGPFDRMRALAGSMLPGH